MIQAYFKGKLVICDNYIQQYEDFKTSSSIGLLQYLPDELIWKILINCCVGLDKKEEDFGKIQEIYFWPHTDPAKTEHKNYVEPDVWIKAEKCDVVIEAKLGDVSGQKKSQWKDEIQSIKNEQKGNKKEIILIALGGNEDMQKEEVLSCKVYRTQWTRLLNAIEKERGIQREKGEVCRILDDVMELLLWQGVLKMHLLETLEINTIEEKVLCNWVIKKH